MSAAIFLTAAELRDGGPGGLTKALSRTLWHLGFQDVRVIDGSHDHGADLLAARGRERWVFQCKWKEHGPAGNTGIDDLERARVHYRADKAVLVTNTNITSSAERRRRDLAGIGVDIALWHGATLKAIGERMPEHVPASYSLRPYQESAVAAIERDLDSVGTALLILATGLGKTVVGGEVIKGFLVRKPGARVLVVAHMRDLVGQLEKALWRHLPKSVPTRLLTGESRPRTLDGVVVATVESALTAVHAGYKPDLIMIDETHHVASTGKFADLLDLCGTAGKFGVTATPWRGDKFDITARFGPPSFKMGIAQGMAAGYLSTVDYKLYSDGIDWDAVQDVSDHGYSIKDLNRRLFLPQRDDEIIERFRSAWRETSSPRAIVFCQTVEHAEHMANLLTTSDPEWTNASCLHSGLPKRDREVLLNEFRLGRVPVITCIDVFNEGVDVPDVNLISFLRVTHSRRIFVQQLGRGLRLSPGKKTLRVLDFVTDIRRAAAVLNLRRTLESQETEHLELPHPSRIEFQDETVGSLLEMWIQDAADLETTADDVRLQFPLPKGIL